MKQRRCTTDKPQIWLKARPFCHFVELRDSVHLIEIEMSRHKKKINARNHLDPEHVT